MQSGDSDMTDLEAVRETLAGTPDAFRPLVRRYQGPMFNLMLRFSGDRDIAAELAQDVFLKAYDGLGTLRDGQSFFPWLYSIGFNLGRDWARRNARSPLVEASDLLERAASAQPGQEVMVRRREESVLLAASLARLPEHYREALLLRYREDASLKDIADVFGLSLSAAKMRVRRGLRKLAAQLAEDGYED